MVRPHSRGVKTAIVLALAAGISGPAPAQSAIGVSNMRCTLVGLPDFAAAHLPRPDQLFAITAPPQEQCRAIYGTGQLPAVIAVQYGPPFQGMPFSQNLKMCRSIKPPCESVAGVGEQAYYQRSGRPIGNGSTQEILASFHGKVLSVQAVGMTVPITKGNLVAFAREVVRRLR